jgi:hypothetical protein
MALSYGYLKKIALMQYYDNIRFKNFKNAFLVRARANRLNKRGVQGWSEFSEGTSAKWIFDIEIEKLRAKIFFTCREDQNYAWCRWKITYSAFETKIF